jgi:hypothetical protein
MPTRPIFGEGQSSAGKQPSKAPVPIYRGNEDSMSGRWFEYRGRPVPDAGSQPATVLQVLVRAGVGEGRATVEAG